MTLQVSGARGTPIQGGRRRHTELLKQPPQRWPSCLIHQIGKVGNRVVAAELGEALVQHDEVLECEHNPQLSFRNTAGIHQAIRIISRLASEQCGKLLELEDPISGEGG